MCVYAHAVCVTLGVFAHVCVCVPAHYNNYINYCIVNAKQKQPACKKVRGQSEATMVISHQNF